jgi:hypothetical protein
LPLPDPVFDDARIPVFNMLVDRLSEVEDSIRILREARLFDEDCKRSGPYNHRLLGLPFKIYFGQEDHSETPSPSDQPEIHGVLARFLGNDCCHREEPSALHAFHRAFPHDLAEEYLALGEAVGPADVQIDSPHATMLLQAAQKIISGGTATTCFSYVYVIDYDGNQALTLVLRTPPDGTEVHKVIEDALKLYELLVTPHNRRCLSSLQLLTLAPFATQAFEAAGQWNICQQPWFDLAKKQKVESKLRSHWKFNKGCVGRLIEFPVGGMHFVVEDHLDSFYKWLIKQ